MRAFMQWWNIENSRLVPLVYLIPKLLLICIIRELRAPLLFHYGSGRVLAHVNQCLLHFHPRFKSFIYE